MPRTIISPKTSLMTSLCLALLRITAVQRMHTHPAEFARHFWGVYWGVYWGMPQGRN